MNINVIQVQDMLSKEGDLLMEVHTYCHGRHAGTVQSEKTVEGNQVTRRKGIANESDLYKPSDEGSRWWYGIQTNGAQVVLASLDPTSHQTSPSVLTYQVQSTTCLFGVCVFMPRSHIVGYVLRTCV